MSPNVSIRAAALSAPAAFRRKPLIIHAMLNFAAPVDSPEREPLLAWLDAECTDWVQRSDGSIVIGTLEGPLRASPGDWIIRGVRGEFYSCKPDIFAQMYSPTAQPGDVDEKEQATPGSLAADLRSLIARIEATGERSHWIELLPHLRCGVGVLERIQVTSFDE